MTALSPTGNTSRAGHLQLIHQALSAPGKYVRTWYVAYLLLGVITAGMVPVLLPLMVVSVSHRLSTVAYVVGGLNLGLLTSPLWGLLAERSKAYRLLFFAGFVVVGIASASLPLLGDTGAWCAVAFAIGAGSAGAATVASLFVVDFAPSAEWEPRIGYLQSFTGSGQVVGLLLAGVFAHGLFRAGLWVSALLIVPAVVLGRVGLPVGAQIRAPGEHRRNFHALVNVRALAAFPHVNFLSGIGYHLHLLNLRGLRRVPQMLGTPFARFMLSWFMLALGVAGFFAYFPVMLSRSYGIGANVSSVIYAAGAAVGIALFILASRWAERFGEGWVYQLGLWIRLGGFLLLGVPLLVSRVQGAAAATAGFVLIVVAWPLLSVAGTGLAARLAPFSEGAAMGLFNAALALGTVVGTFASGPLVKAFGFPVIPVMALVGIAFSVGFGLHLGAKPGPAATGKSSAA